MASGKWSKEEHILAFNLYCKIPFTKINATYLPVIELAKIIGRSNGSVAMKLANFARLDPTLQARNISGLTRGAKGEEEVWNELYGKWEELAWQSEHILANYKRLPIEKTIEVDHDHIPKEGKERESFVKTRINQSFFRKAVLASYDSKCCITGLEIPDLLIASHIIPWSENSEHRVNPSNGLCLNALHDKAFDSGLMTVTPEYKIKISSTLLEQNSSVVNSYFLLFENQSINLPHRFLPDKELLRWHNEHVFIS